jgi:hypothetical protein
MTARTGTSMSHPVRRRALRRAPEVPVHPPEDLSAFISPRQWPVFERAIAATRAAGIPFALGGGLAASFYTGLWRGTKDLDLYIAPENKDAIADAMSAAGLSDYFEKVPYDRKWIYRATADGTVVDSIWALANSRAQVEDDWLTHGPTVELFDERVRLIGPEELVWSKLHVVQRERCDWPDILNVLYATATHIDWNRLIARVDGEDRLLASVLLFFSWLAPGRAASCPEWIWRRLGVTPPDDGPITDPERVRNLDSRPWFCEIDPSELG